MMESRWSLRLAGKVLFASLFIAAGVGHFLATDFFLKVMPPYLPYPRELVLLSGAIEMMLGILLMIPRTSRLAGWGLIALLIAVFPANIHVYLHRDAFPLPGIVHALRLPAQGLLIYWAYAYARR
ncbi:DoxX family protein [Tundrisphaera lichenicola]|uniref:DoxX family protein n=1 Tax=Tundrisphaera lichenicola TaxID=2029860 RepID=UPI003EBE7D54